MTQIVVLVIIGLIWVIFKIFESISNSISENKQNNILQSQRNEKYWNRQIDTSKSLFDRNFDIIQSFWEKIEPDSYRSYYIENLTRDCINEICLAENKTSIQPWYKYLNEWKRNINNDWLNLANQIESYLQNTKNKLRELTNKISKERNKLQELIKQKISPKDLKNIYEQKANRNIFLYDIESILSNRSNFWQDTENLIIEKKIIPEYFQLFPQFESHKEITILNKEIAKYNKNIDLEIQEHEENSIYFKEILDWFNSNKKDFVLQRIDHIMNSIDFPDSFSKTWTSDYDEEQGILILEIELPDISHAEIFKEVELKSKIVEKPLNKKEIKEYAPKIQPALILRVAYEIFKNDPNEIIKLLVVNWWIEYDNPATWINTKTYTASLVVNREQILNLNLEKLDPISAFSNLKWKSAWTLIDIIPITPTMSLNKKDKRFIETKEVLNNLENETNLASMDWQDFESLIAELFEKEFAEKWAEVKVTQSSRDRWVDAIAFDPDPIKWWKFVIQAKRYTRTVDVSAVRDLCAVVKKEWASRWILVTTSSYWPDAYAFAQNEPVTLLNWSELLGLLEKHGYKFRINIAEARKLLKETYNL